MNMPLSPARPKAWPVSFENDQNNITTTDAAFYYYDNLALKDILIREPATPFMAIIHTHSV